MKKIVSLLCAAAMLVGSLAFVGCQNGASANANNSGSVKAAGTGVVMGYVLDNRGEPVEGATVTLGGSSTTTNAGGEFVLSDVPVNVDTANTAAFNYSVTAKKDGYLSAVIPAIAVSYEQKADAGTAAWQTALGTLGGQYKDILLKYAEKDGLRSTTTTVLDNGTNSNNQAGTGTSNVGNDTANNTVVTVNDGSGKDDVMKILANALKDLENLTKDQNYYTQFYSTFGKAVLIPCDATFKGKVRVTTKVKGSTVYSEDLFVPTSKPVVRVSYTTTSAAVENNKNDYTWKAEVDDKGFFSFEKLPSGVELSVSIDSFYETKNDVEYVWSSASGDIIAENSGAEGNAGAINKVKLGSADSNENTYSFILYAQNDKLWITASNLGTNTDAALIKTTDPITFTFNKPILKATIEADTGSEALKEDLKTHGYTSELSEDKKTVTFKPVDGNWTGSGAIVVKAEAEDGAKTVLNNKWTVALDEKTWVSFEGKTFSDTDGFLALSSPIVLKFTRAMTDNVTFTIDSTNEYTRTWNDAKTELTLAPTAEAKYWKLKDGQNYIQISKIAGLAADGTKTIDFWKDGSESTTTNNVTTTTLKVYFNNFVDVTLAKADVTGHEAFTITFSKALKSFNAKDALELVITENKQTGAKTLTLNKDYTVAIDEAKKVITVTSKEAQFPYEGKYKVTFLATLTAEDGSNAFRIAGNKDKEQNIAFVTDFSFEGLVFKPVSIEVLDSLPATAVESRASIVVTTDKVLKFTFNKEVKESKIKITTNNVDATTKNYIDSADAKVVYVPLETVKNTTYDIVLTGTVDAKDDVVTNGNHSDQAVFNDGNIAKWFNNTPDTYTVYAALNLTATSLIKGLDHVTGKPEYSVADPIAAGAPVTFTFDKKLDNEGDVYTASYKIFGKKDVNDANAKIELLVENGTAAVSGNTVTVTDATFKTKKVVGDAAEYYLELRVNNAKGVKVFSTTSPYFGSIANTLEAYAKTSVYDAPATSNPDSTPNNNKNYGSFKIKVAEKNHLTATSLIDETKYSLTKSSYKAAKAIAAKSAITFTFDSLPEGATASYELYDNNTASAKVITSGAATIADKVVTVQSDLLVSGNPKVDGKTFDVKEKLENNTVHTGIYIYYLKLEVKDKNGNVLFSTANKLLQPVTPASNDKRTDFEKAVYDISAKTNSASDTDLFTVEVAPLAVEALSWLPEKKDSFGVTELNSGSKVYDAKTIDPKAAVTITFNAAIPAGAKYSYKISDGTGVIDKTESAKAIDAASNTITIQSNKMTATTDAAATYYIDLSIMNGNDKLFGTDSDHFGNATDFEKAAVKADNIINQTKKAFQVKVTKTQIVKSGDKINGVESKTTSDDDKGFQKSFKSPIVLQFTHPVTGYKAVIYKKTTKLYTDADVSKTHALTSFTEYKTTYDDFVKESAEYIYASTAAVDATNAKLLTITPTNYFKPGEDVNIAIFNDEGKYVAVKDTTSDTYASAKDVTFTAKANTGATHDADEKLANEMLAAAGELAVATPKDGDKLGNGQSIILSVPTTYSTTSKSLPTYKLFLKKAEETGYKWVSTPVTPVDAKANGAAISTVNYLLGRAPTTFFAQTLDNDACDYYNSTTPKYAGYVLIKELDGVLTAYKTAADAIKDEVGPKVSMANLAFTSGGTAFGTLASTSTSIAFELSGTGAPNISATGTPTASAAAITGGFVMKITSAEVVRLADIKYVGKANASATAEPKSSLPTTAHVAFDGDSKVITVTFKSDVVTDGGKAYLYEGDTINIKLTDVSGAEATYTVTIKQ